MENQKDKFTLGLNLPTDPRWVELVEENIEEILTDHAWCEQKAASSCISIIINYTDYKEVIKALTPIVQEEWGHFTRVCKEIEKRGFKLGIPRNDDYVAKLNKIMIKGGSRDFQVVERMLHMALIEARSCERFKVLWKNISEPILSKFYYELMISEAGHYSTFLELCEAIIGKEATLERWRNLLEKEAEMIKTLTVRGDRVH